jgi:siroheme synthase-like protein
MAFLPICLNLENRKVLIVGGGRIALQKLKTLVKYTADITVCAPQVLPEIRSLGVSVVESPYSSSMLEGVSLVFACTNHRDINRRVHADAAARHLLVCVADDPSHCDFISPAIYKNGEMSVAVSSSGRNVRRSVAWRNAIQELLDGK